MQLCKVLEAESFRKQSRFEGSVKVYQVKDIFAGQENMAEIQIAVSKSGIVKSFDEIGQFVDEAASLAVTIFGSVLIETCRQLLFERMAFDGGHNHEASLFEQAGPLAAVCNRLRGWDVMLRKCLCRHVVKGSGGGDLSMTVPVFQLVHYGYAVITLQEECGIFTGEGKFYPGSVAGKIFFYEICIALKIEDSVDVRKLRIGKRGGIFGMHMARTG